MKNQNTKTANATMTFKRAKGTGGAPVWKSEVKLNGNQTGIRLTHQSLNTLTKLAGAYLSQTIESEQR